MDAAASASASKVTLKLLIDKKGQRVLYAEAGKDFVDFLFSLMVLPLSTAIRLLEMEGGIATLRESVLDLKNDYIQPDQNKEVLLKPKSLFPSCSPQAPLLPTEALITYPSASNSAENTAYKCGHCNTLSESRQCPRCYRKMSVSIYVPETYEEGGGFVKGLVKYMVMDDLGVSPMSTVSNITLLKKLNIKDLGDLEEKVVHIGKNEGVELLKHSLNSKTVLTNVFLGKVVVKDEEDNVGWQYEKV